MRTSDLFIGAALPWLRSANEETAREVFARLDRVISTDTSHQELVMRPNWVFNVKNNPVLAAAEPLSRWDSRPPQVIFEEGFQPKLTPADMDAFRQLDDLGVHLHRYVNEQTSSIFVSTSRPISQDGKHVDVWHPSKIKGRYRYEIFAYGGVDVAATFGRHADIYYPEQQEVTFIGGVRRELIRSATEYDQYGRVVSITYNTHFNPIFNGVQAPRLTDLPPIPKATDTIRLLSPKSRGPHRISRRAGSATYEELAAAELAEVTSEREFARLIDDHNLRSYQRWFKSLAEVRLKLKYEPLGFVKATWQSFSTLKKASIYAGGAIWVNGLIHTFSSDTNAWDRAAAVTEIVPFLGCGLQAVAHAVKDKVHPLDTILCLVADGLLISPYFPIGIMIHVVRHLMPFLLPPEVPTIEESQQTRDKTWETFLGDNFYTYLYSHELAYEKETRFQMKLNASLTLEALAVLSQGAQAIGALEALSQNASAETEIGSIPGLPSSQESSPQMEAQRAIQNLRAEMHGEIMRRQRQFLLHLPKTVMNESNASITAVAKQFNDDIIRNMTSRDMLAYYSKPDHTETGLVATDNSDIEKKLRDIAAHLAKTPLSKMPTYWNAVFTIGQSRELRHVDREVFSVLNYMREKYEAMTQQSEDRFTARDLHLLCLHHALQVGRLLRGEITEDQLSKRFINPDKDDVANARELQTLLVLRFGREFDDYKHRNYESEDFQFDFNDFPQYRQLITHPALPPIYINIGRGDFLVRDMGLDNATATALLETEDIEWVFE
ncbi:hypothetical protein AAL_00734 [Moelleriella libera RCEF 2490]|uniref:Pierisin-like domain-containing protein n=1 Tax=Moelleriella libera RCEF 2490 TaxID=1081109 RepID=A0A166V4T4_9HYPO|nr:hypothetical protein AAL_00734 [Moelleriella libera RCEF 2490]